MSTQDAVSVTPVSKKKDNEERVSVASNWTLIWWRFKKHRLAVICTGVLIVLYMIVLVPEFFSTELPENSGSSVAKKSGTRTTAYNMIRTPTQINARRCFLKRHQINVQLEATEMRSSLSFFFAVGVTLTASCVLMLVLLPCECADLARPTRYPRSTCR